jgi:putative CocE/NonD family hydrolase
MSSSMWTGIKDFGDLVIKDVTIEAEDGTRLAARVYLPSEEGSFPTLYGASPYQYDTDTCPASDLFLWYEVGPLEWYVKEQGYAFVHLDVRGTGRSEGEWRVLDSNEQRDHHTAIQWIADQPWSNGKIGGYGQSYYAMSQWLYAIDAPPALACIAPFDGYTEPFTDTYYQGGIPTTFGVTWFEFNVRMQNYYRRIGDNSGHLITYDAVADWLVHNTHDDYWRERSAQPRLSSVEIPVFSIGIWGKRALHLRGNLRGFEAVAGPKWLRVEPAANTFEAHHLFCTQDYHERVLLPFYDRFLKGEENGFESRPKVSVSVLGERGDREHSSWPPASEYADWYLTPGPTGSVSSLNDGGLGAQPVTEEAGTSYEYPDPQWRLGNAKMGPFGPDLVARVLTFTSEPLETPLELAGHPSATIYVSSDEIDSDFIVTVSEQMPNAGPPGRQPPATIISRGWLRASHRAIDESASGDHRPVHHHVSPEPLVPGEIYRLEIELSACSYRFTVGSRVRVEISPTDTSLTEGVFTHHFHWQQVGAATIHHDADHPSHVSLPVLV